MQKKMFGIIAGVAAAHAVLLVGLVAGGGCRGPEILGPHTYNEGPSLQNPPAVTRPAQQGPKPARTAVVPPVPKEVNVPPPPIKEHQVKPLKAPKAPKTVKQQKPAKPVKVVPPASGDGKTYTVRKGDSLSVIARKHGVRTSDLAAYNNIPKERYNSIRIGQKLQIPAGGTFVAPKNVPATAPKTVAKSKKVAADLPADRMYVVKSGDSLERIGRRYGVSSKAIARENNILESKTLRIGEKLRIPEKSAAATSTGKSDKSVAPKDKPAAKKKPEIEKDPFADLDPAVTTDTGKKDVKQPAADKEALKDSIEVPTDTTLEEYSKLIDVPVDALRKANPQLPADGKLSAGTMVTLPPAQN